MRGVRTIETLQELVDLAGSRVDLFVRWCADAEEDRIRGTSIDELTGVELPGLSTNPLCVEPWWEDRPMDVWVARRLYDYRHLQHKRDEKVRAWVMSGDVVGRGPDNEPLVRCREVLAVLTDRVTEKAASIIDAQPNDWGSLDRG